MTKPFPERKSTRGLTGLASFISPNPLIKALLLSVELYAFVTIMAAEFFYFEFST